MQSLEVRGGSDVARLVEASEEHLLKQAWMAGLDREAGQEPENMVLRIFIREFMAFTENRAPEAPVTIDAIQSAATFAEGQTMAGVACKEFRKHHGQLSLLKEMFPRRQRVRIAEAAP